MVSDEELLAQYPDPADKFDELLTRLAIFIFLVLCTLH